MDYIVKQFSEGDECYISSLFKVVFKRNLPLDFWRWRYQDNPFGGSIIKLMFHGDTLVGHYAVHRIKVVVDGKEKEAALSMTTMTHPDYRGRGIFPELARCVYKQCEDYGIELVFGFPNENIYRSRVEKLGWIGFGKVQAWFLENIQEKGTSESQYVIREIMHFDDRFDLLWEKAKPDSGFILPRTKVYLNWRYFLKPGNEYHVVALIDSSGNIKGYAVYKIYHGGNEKVGHIIDFLFIKEPGVAETIIDYGLRYFFAANVDSVSLWVQDKSEVERILIERGFKRKEWPCYFGLKYLGNYCGKRSVLQYKDLYLTMGDSDVF